jgi:hypothetical protein
MTRAGAASLPDIFKGRQQRNTLLFVSESRLIMLSIRGIPAPRII